MPDEEQTFGKPEKLIDVDYSYENIVKNPILKAISETDRTVLDLMEMAYKKTIDASKDKNEINELIERVPAYQTSNMINRLITRSQEIDDLIKIQNLIIRNLRGCIKEVYNEVITSYGVYKEEKKEMKKIDYRDYIIKCIENPKIKNHAELILAEFDKDKSTLNEKRKFENACGNVYTKQDSKDKIIVAKILRMEY